MVCLNDNIDKIDFDVMKYKIQEAFEHILPEKSLKVINAIAEYRR